ncbi:MAG: hypothetical protein LBL33_03035 [Tannerella sp.]|jgi:uncharacterized membrane protein|nr:hypothetical protein [Tannerella sp.]
MEKATNTFVTFLDILGIKHTKSFSAQYFNQHPHKYNLFGLSEMLSDYGIRNGATRIEDKVNDIQEIQTPFIAHTGNDFVMVNKVETDKVHYLWHSKKITIPISKFVDMWSGVILLAETSINSGEPDYAAHRTKDLLTFAQQSILVVACALILGLSYTNYSLFTNPGITLLLLVNLIGVYICYLLVLKQLRIHSRYADKICTLFSKSDCNNVLESEAAKLWGIFGWSEIGLGYFAANVVILLFLPKLMVYSVIINILALPYTVWSVWYQKFKAR